MATIPHSLRSMKCQKLRQLFSMPGRAFVVEITSISLIHVGYSYSQSAVVNGKSQELQTDRTDKVKLCHSLCKKLLQSCIGLLAGYYSYQIL